MFYSILDTDFYKFTTSYAAMMKFPQAEAVFEFKDRNRKKRTPEFLKKLKELMDKFCTNAHDQEHSLTTAEYVWLCENVPFIAQFYWEWLDGFKFSYSKMEPYLDEDGVLVIRVEDKWYKSSLYEIPCMFLTAQAENITNGNIDKVTKEDVIARLTPKIELANKTGLKFSEFGTRRRFSQEVQDEVCKYLKANSMTCTGTSNVYFARKYGMKPMGTHPHEFFQAHQIYGFRSMNYMALENWSSIYSGNLGTALVDTCSTNAFLQNFTMKHAKLFDGVRQDSGDEFEFVDKFVAKYKELGIDPMTKTIIFSNALDFPKAVKIQEYCEGKIKCSFGFGTNLTNDTGFPSENIVMKMTKFRLNDREPWMDVIKISDDAGKHMGNEKLIEMAKYQLGIE
jgi:nicotinate phosphoribosyltransferase